MHDLPPTKASGLLPLALQAKRRGLDLVSLLSSVLLGGELGPLLLISFRRAHF